MKIRPSLNTHRQIRLIQSLIPAAIFLALALMPLLAFADPGDEYEVAGAGTTAVNGVYVGQADFVWGGARYTFDNGGTTYYLCNDNAAAPYQWVIARDEVECIFGMGYYRNNSTSVMPPETGWMTDMGSDPPPNVAPAVQGARISKDVSTAYRLVTPGEPVTYTLFVRNTASTAVTNVLITDTVPLEVENVTVTSSGLSLTPVGGSRYVWNVADLAAGQSGYITITGMVNAGMTAGVFVTNTAGIAASAGGGDSSATFTVSWWRSLGQEGFTNDAAYETSLALNSLDVPYIAYRDIMHNNEMMVMRYTGAGDSGWEVVGSPHFSAGEAFYPSLAMDGSGVPYVAYQDKANGNRATVMRYTMGSWETVGTAGFSANGIAYISLDMDSNGRPYVAFNEPHNGTKMSVMRYTGSAWELVGTANFSAGFTYYPSLVLDSGDVPYLAYRDESLSGKVVVMRYTGNGATGWESVGAAGFSDGQVGHVKMQLDGSDVPYVGYTDYGGGSTATVMRYTGVGATGWETVGSRSFSPGSTTYFTMDLDQSGRPYVGFADTDEKATVMRYTGSGATGWEIVDLRGFSGNGIAHPNLVLASDDVPFVAYTDYANGTKASLMTYDPTPPGPATCEVVSSGNWNDVTALCHAGDKIVIPAGVTVVLDSDIEISGDFEIQGTLNPNGKTVTLTGSGDQTLTGSLLNFYRLTVNKTNKTDTVHIVGKLKVSKKLSIVKGKLISASDYSDVEILVDGALELTSDISVSGTFTNDGEFIANTYTVVFDGTTAQTLTGDTATAFYGWVINPTAQVFIVTTPTVAGDMENYGTITQTQTVNNSTVNFLQISTDKYRGVDITTSEDLGAVSVTIRGNAADCTGDPTSPPYRTRCFRVDVETSDFYTADMTFYTTAVEDIIANDTVYQYYADFEAWADVGTSSCDTVAGESCAADSVTLDAGPNFFVIAGLDDSPTAVNLSHVTASSGQSGWLPLLALVLVVGGLVGTRLFSRLFFHGSPPKLQKSR